MAATGIVRSPDFQALSFRDMNPKEGAVSTETGHEVVEGG